METIRLLLARHNEKKQIRAKLKKVHQVDKIISIKKRNCKYVGGEREGIHQHLEVKFTSQNETGIICMSVLFEKYEDIIQMDYLIKSFS